MCRNEGVDLCGVFGGQVGELLMRVLLQILALEADSLVASGTLIKRVNLSILLFGTEVVLRKAGACIDECHVV